MSGRAHARWGGQGSHLVVAEDARVNANVVEDLDDHFAFALFGQQGPAQEVAVDGDQAVYVEHTGWGIAKNSNVRVWGRVPP